MVALTNKRFVSAVAVDSEMRTIGLAAGVIAAGLVCIFLYGKLENWQILFVMLMGLMLIGLRRPVFAAGTLVVSELTAGSVFIDIGGGGSVLSLRLLFTVGALMVLMPQILRLGWLGRHGVVTVYIALAYCSWQTVSNVVNAEIVDVTVQYARYLFVFFVSILLVPAVVSRRGHLVTLGWMAVAGATLSATLAIYQHYVVGGLWQGRAPGFTAHPVNLVAMLPIALLPMISMAMVHRMKSQTAQVLLYTGILLVLLGLYFTYTRSFMVAGAAGMAFLMLYSRGAARWIMSLGLFVFVLIFLVFYNSAEDARLTTSSLSVNADGSSAARPILWGAAFAISEQNLLYGVGRDGFRVLGPSFVSTLDDSLVLSGTADAILGRYDPHNDYIYALVSAGIPGAVLYILMHLIVWWNFHTAFVRSRDWFIRGLSAGGVAALWAWVANALVHNAFDASLLLGVMMGFSIACVKVASSEPQWIVRAAIARRRKYASRRA